MTAPMVTSSTGSSLQRLAEQSWQRNAAGAVLHYEGGQWTGEQIAGRIRRVTGLIIRGGYNVYPRDVEDVLMQHPDVLAAAAVGRPDPTYGEEVVAFVQLREGATAGPDELISYGRQHLSAVKYPREVHIVAAIPLTSVLKIDRKRLRATLTGG